jgi:hypothetical protein
MWYLKEIACFCFVLTAFSGSNSWAEDSTEIKKASGSKVKTFRLDSFIRFQVKAYERQDWDHFFGSAQMYRKHWWKANPSMSLVSLEVLALVKFCRFFEALQILHGLESWQKNQAILDTAMIARINELRTLIDALSEGKIDVRLSKSISSSEESRKAKSVYWPAGDSVAPSMLPSDFVLKVSSQCD